jgi:hypothetical protein
MQTTQLVAQNSVDQRDVGAASGAVTLFRTLGGSLGVSLLGTLFTQQMQSTLADRGAPAQQADGGHLTPSMLGQLPVPLRDAYQTAITSGIQQVFLWGALIAALGLIAAWVIREVPLRDTETPATPDATATAPGISGRVCRPDASPVVGTPVTVIDTAGREIAVGHTSADGSYRLQVPAPGAYLIVTSALVTSAAGHHPAASLITVTDHPVEHDIILPHRDSTDSWHPRETPVPRPASPVGARS